MYSGRRRRRGSPAPGDSLRSAQVDIKGGIYGRERERERE